jgi:hypothetical protein
VRERRNGNLDSAWRLHVNLGKNFRTRPPLLFEGKNHVVLIDRFVHHRHLTLTERIVESAVDRLRRQTEARSCIAVDQYILGKSGVLLIGADVCNFGKGR